MANPKKKKFHESLNKISPSQFGEDDYLSPDLAQKVGNLAERTKITIRLDSRVIEEAKKLGEELGGLSYQKILNDRLLSSFGFKEGQSYDQTYDSVKKLLDEKMNEFREVEDKLIKRIERLERKEA